MTSKSRRIVMLNKIFMFYCNWNNVCNMSALYFFMFPSLGMNIVKNFRCNIEKGSNNFRLKAEFVVEKI